MTSDNYQCTVTEVIRHFRNKRLKRLFFQDDSRKLPAEHVPKVRRILARLDAARTESDMQAPTFHLHQLKGDRKREWAVTVYGNWRITFKMENGDAVDVDYIDYH